MYGTGHSIVCSKVSLKLFKQEYMKPFHTDLDQKFKPCLESMCKHFCKLCHPLRCSTLYRCVCFARSVEIKALKNLINGLQPWCSFFNQSFKEKEKKSLEVFKCGATLKWIQKKNYWGWKKINETIHKAKLNCWSFQNELINPCGNDAVKASL